MSQTSTKAADEARELAAILDELKTLTDETYPLTSPLNPRFPTHTRVGTVEIFPDTVTPAMWTSTGEGMSRIATGLAREMRLIPQSEIMLSGALFYGQVATNVSAYFALNRRLPGAPWWPWSKAALQLRQDEADLISGWEPPSGLGAWLVDTFWRLHGRRAFARLEESLQAEVGPREQELDRLEAETDTRDFSDVSAREILDQLKTRGNNASLVRLHMGVTFLIGNHFIRLRHALAQYTAFPPGTTAPSLLVSLGDIESTKAAQALRDLAIEIREAPRLTALLKSNDLEGFAAALNAPADAVERKIAKARADFLRDYGYRGIGEAALDAKTWSEAPEQADAMLALYVADPSAQKKSGAARREELEGEILNSIEDPAIRRRMGLYIANAQKFASLREHTKSLTVRQSLRTRRTMKALVQKLVEEGAFETAEDRQFLSMKEVMGALDMTRADLHALISRRRKAFELLQKLDVQEITFDGLPTPRLKTYLKAEEAAATLEVGASMEGLSVCPGRAEGLARVVLDPRLGADIKPGEILVAPFTDAAWSPIFLMAAGVVIDTGMPISHGATLARELGLPAVVNVPGTSRLRTGDRILLDADTGKVTLLERAAPEAEPVPEAQPANSASNLPLDDAAMLEALRALRLKGRATQPLLLSHLALDEEGLAARLEAAVKAELAEFTGRFWRMTPAGADWLERALTHVRPDRARADALYDAFMPLNGAFKQLTFDWQMRDAETPNDHSDIAYDQAVLARLDPIHAEIQGVLTTAENLAGRLTPMRGRLDQALTRLKGGETKFLMSPTVDSYHTVWFELHEELIDLAGRTRAEEAAEGRAA